MPIDPSEIVSRYIFDGNAIRANNSVKAKAFIPRNKGPKEISVFRTSFMADHEIWRIGTNVGEQSNRPSLKGRADLLTSDVIKIGLRIIESEPPPKHANIIGFSKEKEDVLLFALKLCKIANVVRV